MKLTDDQMVIARAVCTERQLHVLELRQLDAGWRRIALLLGVTKPTVKDHWEAAMGRIERAEAMLSDPNGSLVLRAGVSAKAA